MRRAVSCLVILFLFGWAAGGPSAATAAATESGPASPAARIETDEGTLGNARYSVARPPGKWNRRLLLLAHGLRPEFAPLIPDLQPDRLACRTLLDEGWMVAATSYRRNGMIVADAIADLDALREHIAHEYGDPERVILEGESMGGLIVAIMAERDPGTYSGAIAIGAVLSAKESNMPVGLSLLPRIPLLFVSSQSELAGPKGYVNAKISRPDPIVPPALFRISRDGHANVNERELLAALRAVNAWLDSGPGALPHPAADAPFFDATVPPDPGPSTVHRLAEGHGFETHVSEVSAVYGNVVLDAQADDFASAGIAPMTFFLLRAGETSFRTLYGRDVADVRRGEWVAFPDAEGHTVLSRNYADAAGSAHLEAGSSVSLIRYDP